MKHLEREERNDYWHLLHLCAPNIYYHLKVQRHYSCSALFHWEKHGQGNIHYNGGEKYCIDKLTPS